MFHRTYPIQLRAGVTRERIDGLRAVLAAAPEHIPGFLESELVGAPPGSGHDLVWRNVFENEDAFWLYAGHPYHANLINDYLAPDAPDSVKASSSAGTIWSDDGPIDPVRMADLRHADAALEAAGIDARAVHLLEQVEVLPGKMNEYLVAVRDIYLPAATRNGMHLMTSWQTPSGTGESELTFVWSVEGWGGAFRSFVAVSQEVDMMEQWLETVRPLRSGGRRRYLVPTGLPGEWSK
ncbi:hypothetical protein JCM18899A_22460 [Nocardioides sp. AN3]